MADLTTSTVIKGVGMRFDVRSYKLTRMIDLSALSGLGTSAYYEIGDLPAGFIPRNVAILELVKAGTAGTISVYLKKDSLKVAERTLASATGATYGHFFTGTVASTVATIVQNGTGGTLCIKFGTAVASTGVVKIVVSGDLMADDAFDAADGQGAITPADTVAVNKMN